MESVRAQQMAALRKVADIARRRQAALAEVDRLTEELRVAAIAAASFDDAPLKTIRGLTKMNANKVHIWWQQAGLDERRVSEGWLRTIDVTFESDNRHG